LFPLQLFTQKLRTLKYLKVRSYSHVWKGTNFMWSYQSISHSKYATQHSNCMHNQNTTKSMPRNLFPTNTFFFITIISDSKDTLTPTFFQQCYKYKLNIIDSTCSTLFMARVFPYVSFKRTFSFSVPRVVLESSRYTCSSPSPAVVSDENIFFTDVPSGPRVTMFICQRTTTIA